MSLLRSPLAAVCALSLLVGCCAGYWMRPAVETTHVPAASRPADAMASPVADSRASAATNEEGHANSIALHDFDAAVRSALSLGDDLDRQLRMREIARGLAQEDMPAVLEQVKALPEDNRYEVIFALGTQWGRVAPQAALELALRLKDNEAHNSLLRSCTAAWATQAPDAAEAWIAKLPRGEDRNMAFGVLLDKVAAQSPHRIMEIIGTQPLERENQMAISQAFMKWGQRDPTAAVAAAARLPHGSDVREAAHEALTVSWAEKDSASALAWVEQINEPALRRKLAAEVAIQWGRKDPAAAFAYALQLPVDRTPRFGLLNTVIAKWAANDPAAAQAAVLALPPGRGRDEAMYGLVTGLAPDHAEAALTLLLQLPAGSNRTEIAGEMVRNMKVHDMPAAASYVASLPPGPLRIQMSGDLVQRWADDDFNAALAWTKQLPPGRERGNALAQLTYRWASADPRGAVDFLARESSGGPRDYGLENALGIWCQKAPDEALAWVLAQPAAGERDSLILHCIMQIQRTEPAQAARLFTTQLTTATDGNVAGQIADAWAGDDPKAAVEWAAALPDEAARSRALSGAVGVWASHDPVAAASYVQGFAAGPARDAVVESLSNAVWPVDHEGAIAWMATIGEPEERAGRLNGFVSDWFKEDAVAARGWLDRTALLDPSAKRRLLYRFEHPDGPDDGPP